MTPDCASKAVSNEYRSVSARSSGRPMSCAAVTPAPWGIGAIAENFASSCVMRGWSVPTMALAGTQYPRLVIVFPEKEVSRNGLCEAVPASTAPASPLVAVGEKACGLPSASHVSTRSAKILIGSLDERFEKGPPFGLESGGIGSLGSVDGLEAPGVGPSDMTCLSTVAFIFRAKSPAD